MSDQYNNRYSCPAFNKELKQEFLYDLPKQLNISHSSTSKSVASMPEHAKATTPTPLFAATLSYSPNIRAHERSVASSSKQHIEHSPSVSGVHSNLRTNDPPTSLHEGHSSDSEVEDSPVKSQLSPSSSFSSSSRKTTTLRTRTRPIPLNLSGSIRSFSDAPKSGSFSKRWKKGAPTPPGTPTKHHFAVRYVRPLHTVLGKPQDHGSDK
ncbi:hypothetical protein K493DRAFT_1723 [Basidiobolus meristosporus CBS 931.73]|uniref:Uncharacterized protein n=1 Tax=Basidiobolus meristosporus CBS 931.73 TaxID=1314790 RepID=A0A1Y1YMG0_9FUNG|nr:hypothetical protein K493DRAFT_1723 [Basidiobolus meristosporus CBS 931.73]|eukprot:ORX99168.1 hypothetical protein K493DRAFT_1723 [Basidiobolus meristosporus CBS 931.73]